MGHSTENSTPQTSVKSASSAARTTHRSTDRSLDDPSKPEDSSVGGEDDGSKLEDLLKRRAALNKGAHTELSAMKEWLRLDEQIVELGGGLINDA